MPEPIDPAVVPPVAPAEPPWGADFDPARAWTTIQTLREAEKERNALRGQVAELAPQAKQFRDAEEASKTESERLAGVVEASRRDAEIARAETIRYKVAATLGIGADHFDLLGSGTEVEIQARAEKIAALVAGQVAPVQVPVTAPGTRTVEQLKPGAIPVGQASEDDVLYAQLFGA
jgi:hypothetical protein